MTLEPGNQAPDFSTVDHKGDEYSSAKLRGQWVLLYFYPKDNTPGCTKEACAFRDNYAELSEQLVLLGVSGDSAESHRKFAEKHELPFPLLVDPDKEIIRSYGADGTLFPKRVSFLINPEGKIAKVYPKVNVNAHAEQILKEVRELKS